MCVLAQALSADGRCKTFDASADGYGRGEGFAVAYLTPSADSSPALAFLQVCLCAMAPLLCIKQISLTAARARWVSNQQSTGFTSVIALYDDPKWYHTNRKVLTRRTMLLSAGDDGESGWQVILPDCTQWSLPEAAHCSSVARCRPGARAPGMHSCAWHWHTSGRPHR